MNGIQFVEAARAFADQLIHETRQRKTQWDLSNDAFRADQPVAIQREKEAIILLQFSVNKRNIFTIQRRPKNFLKSDITKQNQKIFLTWLR